jgi:hypothetical protein
VWIIAIHLACTAVARVTYKQLKGDEFYSSGDAWKYVRKHWHPVIFTSISMVLILVFFIGMAAVFALFGKIPYVGEFFFALPYLLYFFGAVFTVYTAVVFLVSLIYTPTIVGTIEEDTMGAVFNSYSITWSQPWRVILYHMILLPLAALSVGLFKAILFCGFKLVNMVFGHEMLMGQKLTNIMGSAAQAVWPQDFFTSITNAYVNACANSGSCCGSCSIGSEMLNDFYACFIPVSSGSLSGTESIATFIVGVFLFLITLSFFSYFLSILSVGETIMFTIFRKKSDDDNILDRKDEEEFEDDDDDDDDLNFDNDEPDESESNDSESEDKTPTLE